MASFTASSSAMQTHVRSVPTMRAPAKVPLSYNHDYHAEAVISVC